MPRLAGIAELDLVAENAEGWIGAQRTLWTRRLDQLDDYLRQLNAMEKRK